MDPADTGEPASGTGAYGALGFFGGAGTVTGAKYLVTSGGHRFLLDCGLFQGLKELRLRNWAPPAFAPTAIEAVVLSHAHIDHTGYLPLLARLGFRGPIYCTAPTADLLRVLLLDSARLQEEEAETANRYGYSKHHPARPLYDTSDAHAALLLVVTRGYAEPFAVAPGASALFRRAGHILGAATVEVRLGGARPLRLVYSGDLGRRDRPILRDPEPVGEADVLLVESTYGDRSHALDAIDRLAELVRDTAARGGVVIVPSFAVGRAQELLWILRRLEEERRIPPLPIFIDSPMAIDVTEIYSRHGDEHAVDRMAPPGGARFGLAWAAHHFVRSVAESKALNERRGPMIVIAGSGMATGGRVLHHLRLRLPDPRTTVVLPGYQAAGTRGRSLQEGAKRLRMFGEWVTVRARIASIDGLSAHADRGEILRWLRGFVRPPQVTYVVHGEAAAAGALARRVREELGWEVRVAIDGQTVALDRTRSHCVGQPGGT
ncbi:MAG: MBL fold metallo-hydrolase [Deltaproteobacteria bacterium]|nr:MBL fold metallo-hydrolase [Deltaproteobacteria bacterium]